MKHFQGLVDMSVRNLKKNEARFIMGLTFCTTFKITIRLAEIS